MKCLSRDPTRNPGRVTAGRKRIRLQRCQIIADGASQPGAEGGVPVTRRLGFTTVKHDGLVYGRRATVVHELSEPRLAAGGRGTGAQPEPARGPGGHGPQPADAPHGENGDAGHRASPAEHRHLRDDDPAQHVDEHNPAAAPGGGDAPPPARPLRAASERGAAISMQARHKGVECYRCHKVITDKRAIAKKFGKEMRHTRYYHIQCWESLFI